ncbi:dihydrodipicolinate synthase family protein [Roseivivax sediminis]|uniref:4-hydroxy-tetrahydrodipicolinate synthase n=1 Tax=Roseivivax sediminis TaxID=936889 RepID=A0A1I1WLA9_9RHOB|nr:dihydrodipicolinate synthase family protein [Roseivivax sediminis]SFD94193.1 4-hydroxy-tetrahydrodipicolinate synthase [Roseivivax sediminis]
MNTTTIAAKPTGAAPRAHLFGVSAAMVTPFTETGAVDCERAAGHAVRVIEEGADGITLFGTTGEGSSLGLRDREELLSAVLDAGIAPSRITAGIAASDLEMAETQARMVFQRGVRRLLLAPPFYFKGITAEALHDWVADFVARVSDAQPQIILYHIPQVTAVGFAPETVRRIKQTCGDAIFGVKDSGGDWSLTSKLLPMEDLAILIGDERSLARAAPLGGAGAISGMANLVPRRVGAMVRQGQADPALDAFVEEVVTVPVTPMVKALVGAMRSDPAWTRTRLPLSQADVAAVNRLADVLAVLRQQEIEITGGAR